jgi:hypothetical protein
MKFIYKKNKKITRCEKIILQKELDFEPYKKYNICELDKFYKKFNHYMLVCKLLYKEPSFYSTLKFIQLDQTKNQCEYIYHEIIWTHEHYNYIEELRLIETDINQLIDCTYQFELLSNIQLQLIKKITKIIPNIFYSDTIFMHLYSHDTEIKLPTQNQLDYYFNIIETIILKMYKKTKNNKKTYDIEKLLYDDEYIKSFGKLKNELKQKLNLACV